MEIKFHVVPQWIATFAMFLLLMVAGVHLGWASPNFARFISNQSDVSMTPRELTWLASSDSLGAILGAISGPISIEAFGPKRAGLFSFAFYSITWICIMLGKNYVWLLIARFIGGHAFTIAQIGALMYLGEISKPEIRGTMISIATTGGASGVLCGIFLETYLPAEVTCSIYLVPCFVGIVLLLFVLPESPYFLAKIHDVGKTMKSIVAFFPDQKVEEKLIDVQNFMEDQAKTCVKEKLKMLKTTPVNKSLILIIILYSLVQSSGMINILRFMEIILRRGKLSVIKPQKLVLYINAVSILLRLLTCNVADKFGRRFLLTMASILITLSLLSLGIYFYLLNSNVALEGFEWFPILCLFLFVISFSIGFYAGVHTVMSEIFPPNVKNMAICIVLLIGSFFDFISTTIFLPISDSYGEQYIFWIHASCAFFVSPLVIFFLPETKGKTLEEIQNCFRRN